MWDVITIFFSVGGKWTASSDVTDVSIRLLHSFYLFYLIAFVCQWGHWSFTPELGKKPHSARRFQWAAKWILLAKYVRLSVCPHLPYWLTDEILENAPPPSLGRF